MDSNMSLDDNGFLEIETENIRLHGQDNEFRMENSDEEEMTSDRLLQAIENVWLNEKFAPELLPNQMELLDCMFEQISNMENNLKMLKKEDLRLNIHTMELMRIKYIISSYLRNRLDKIEEFAIHLLQSDSQRSPEEAYMTPSETEFAREYISGVESLFKSIALNHMPQSFNKFELDKFASKPNLNSHVFLKSRKSIQGILIPNADEEIDFEPDSQHIIRYSIVSNLVKNSDVQLI